MVFRTHTVLTTDRMREIIRSQDHDFPYTALESDVSLFTGRCSPWHWHGCFEFATVIRGSIELRTGQFSALLREGDGYFVNANVLHLCKAADDEEFVRLHVHQFERSLLANSPLIARRYVSPIENAATLEAVVFRAGQDADILSALNRAFAAADTEEAAWELELSTQLFSAWRALYNSASGRLSEPGTDCREDVLRAKSMLSFIHENYSEPITVEEIARAAGVCERECFRCFARVMDTTPKTYLARYRVGIAARLLSETDESITQIAYRCGFANSSYFGKVFRQLLGCSPREFRRS